MSDLTQEFAINCNPSTAAKPPQYAGKGQAKGHVRAMLDDVRSAHLAGKHKKAKHRMSRYLNSYHAKLVATELARRTMKPHRRFPKPLVPSIASGLDAWLGTPEEVRVNMTPKDLDSGDYRLTMDFGPEHRALQHLVRRVLKMVADLHPHQFGTGNGGLHAAIKHVAQAMKDGFVWAVEIDVESCFPSFEADKVADLLPLPKEVTERVLLSRHLNLVPGNLLDLLGGVPGGAHEGVPYGVPHTPHIGPASGLGILGAEVLVEARWGFAQGSAVSPIVSEMLLALPLKQLPQIGEVFGYLDNFLIMAKSEDDAVSMAKALGCALKAHPAGPLRPKIKGRFHSADPIEFLGHRLIAHHGAVIIEPSPANLKSFEYEMGTGLASIKSSPASSAARLRKARGLTRKISGWASAFGLCEDIQLHKQHWLAKIADCS